MVEEWRIVPSNQDYEASTLGRVRRREGTYVWGGRCIGFFTKSGGVIQPCIASHGYPVVVLGKNNTRTVHSIITETFLGPTPEGQEIRHKDGDRQNPRLGNLHFGTRTENMIDAYLHSRRDQVAASIKAARTREERYGPGWTALAFLGVSYSKAFDL